MAIFNPAAQTGQEKGDAVTHHGRLSKNIKESGMGVRHGRRVGFVCFLSTWADQNCVGGQPPIMSTSKTRALMAAVCLRGGLLHTTVLQKQLQIYKTTIRKRGKINQNAIKVE